MSDLSSMPEPSQSKDFSSGKKKRKSYHRGNVREDLTRLALEILENEGLNAITLRRLTREIGVNPTNFYNHFPNMDHLHAAIKVEGHLKMQKLFRNAINATSGKQDAIRAVVHEYVFFAIKRPNLYRLMFDHVPDYQQHIELKIHSDRTISMVAEILYGPDIYDAADPIGFYKTHPLAVSCWSLVHGLAHILIERQINIKLRSRKKVTEFIDNVFNELLHGIESQLQS